MGRVLITNYFRLAPWTLALVCLLSSLELQGQTVTAPAQGAAVQGIVRDSGGRPVGGAKVSLKTKEAGTLTIITDRGGAYRFSSMRRGDYLLSVEKVGYANATVDPFTLARSESRTINLTLVSEKSSDRKKDSEKRPAFFDEPHFTVAGVTDTTNLGGHGSDTVVRNREALAKATASLSPPASADASAESGNAAVEKQLRVAVQQQPEDFDANFQLGKLLVDRGKAEEALVYLESASQLKPNDYDDGYELALARADTGDYQQARTDILAVLNSLDKTGQKRAEPHHLLAEVCEKLNRPLDAVREYQRAAELNASEAYLFDWGAELLLHHAAEPAVEVFTKGNRLFPRSSRILAGLGASWYALGSYENAVQGLCEASDLNPGDSNPYLFLGRVQAVESTPSAAITERLQRFARLQPENAMANYYYAISVWKGRKSPVDADNFAQVKPLLEKAIHLDPAFGPAYLQLGILYSERRDLSNSVAAYQNAIQASPDMEEAHYRLAQAYRQEGETSKAQVELQRYEQISKEKAAEIEQQRHEMQQFVYELREPATDTKPQ
jgi:tetratricopeptide (TPR) repeat protein